MSRRRGGIAAPLTMLIVDRSPMQRAMLKRVLQLSAVPIAAIVDTPHHADALAQLASAPVHALFVGVDPPGDHGLELLRVVVQRDEWRQVVCVATGAHPVAALAHQPSLPPHRTLETPFTVAGVREVLRELIGVPEILNS